MIIVVFSEPLRLSLCAACRQIRLDCLNPPGKMAVLLKRKALPGQCHHLWVFFQKVGIHTRTALRHSHADSAAPGPEIGQFSLRVRWQAGGKQHCIHAGTVGTPAWLNEIKGTVEKPVGCGVRKCCGV